MMAVVENLTQVKTRLAGAGEAFGLPKLPHPPQLIAVTKTHEAEAIRPLLEAGHRHFGENRVQEAAAKWPALKSQYPDIVLHMIGPLQTNKVKDALELFDVIHTLDRPSLLESFAKHPPKRVLIQVNTGNEPQKAGIAPLEADSFIEEAKKTLGNSLTGLMCIPPVEENPAPHFGLLKLMAARHNLPDLSMGMSGDYQLAAAMGATFVRVGSALFGERG